ARPAPFARLIHSPALGRRHPDAGTFLRFNRTLEADARELAIMTTAREKDCPYIWAAHAPTARLAGLSEAVIAVVRDRGDLAALPAIERDMADYVRQLAQKNAVSAVLFDRLQRRH